MNLFKLFFSVVNISIYTVLFFLKADIGINGLHFIEIYTIFCFSVLYFLNVKIYGFFHIICFFHITCFLFLLGRVFGDIVGLINIFEFFSIINTYFSISTVAESIIVINLALLYFNMFSIFTVPKKLGEIKPNENFLKIGKFLILFILPIVFYKNYLEYKFILKEGYTSYYLGATKSINYNIPFIELFSNFFLVGYFIFIAGCPSKKDFKRYSFLFIAVMVMDSLKGMRSAAILPILFYFWYLGNYYKINARKLVLRFSIIVFILIGFSAFLIQQRTGIKSVADARRLLSFIPDSGTSLNLMNLFVVNRNSLPENKVGFIFEPIVFPLNYITNFEILRKGQSPETVKIRENLNHRLTYYLNRGYYINGGGLGTSYIAEMYEFGYMGIFFFNGLLAVLFGLYYKYSGKRITLFFAYLIVIHILIMPRAEYFFGLWAFFKFFFFFLLVKITINLLKKMSNKDDSLNRSKEFAINLK